MERDRLIRVVLAEDEELIRHGIEEKIETIAPEFTVVASVGDGRAALNAVRLYNPQVVITDIKMPQMDGLELAHQLSLSYPGVKVVILSGYSDFEYTKQAICCGVFNYLLKPVENEALAEVLDELKVRITAYRYQQNRTVVYSSGFQTHKRRGCRCALFAVCIGNLCYDVKDKLLSQLYEQQLAKIDWHPLLEGLYPQALDWYLADEEEKNQKLICYSVCPGQVLDHRALAEKLQESLQRCLPGVPVCVCTALGTFEESEAWICAQRLRNILQQKVVLARSSVFTLEQDERFAENDSLGIIKMRITDHLQPVLHRQEKETVRHELQLLFGYLADNNVSQADVQRILLYILRLMEFSENRFVDLQQEVFRAACRLYDPALTAPVLTRSIMRCMGEPELCNSEELAIQLKRYIDKNYLTLENLEDLAKIFSYSYAYLSRLFTLKNGTSMMRYILTRRMELAKQLIRNNENLSVQQIAEMSGYADGRYFSRLFKAYSGYTPSDYRAKVS